MWLCLSYKIHDLFCTENSVLISTLVFQSFDCDCSVTKIFHLYVRWKAKVEFFCQLFILQIADFLSDFNGVSNIIANI